MRFLASVACLICAAAACSRAASSYEGQIAIYVEHNGAAKAADHFESAAKGGGPDDVFKFYLFNLMYGDQIPGYEFGSNSANDAILNCAASAGSGPAIEKASNRILAIDPVQAPRINECVTHTRAGLKSGWTSCGGEALLPACPASFAH